MRALLKPNYLIMAMLYTLFVIVTEVALFYLVRFIPGIADYLMILTTFVLLTVSWLLKPNVNASIFAVLLIALYGLLSFYSDFPIYYVGYPNSLEEFLPEIGLKTLFYAFPLIAYVAVTRKPKANS